MNQEAKNPRVPLFTVRSVVLIGAVFSLLVGTCWACGRVLLRISRQHGWDLDLPYNFPLSMFSMRLPGVHTPLWTLGISAAVLLLFVLVAWNLRRVTTGLVLVLAAGVVLVVGTNLIQGPVYGLQEPHRDELQYFHDAAQVDSAGRFLREFHTLQPELGCHSKTHPPGAVLFFHGLIRAVGHPAAVSLVIAALGVVISGGFLYGILAGAFNRDTAAYATLLCLLIPNVQIYYCATLDAVIAGCFLSVVFFLRLRRTPIAVAGGIAGMFCASFLTFGAVFLPPVILSCELVTRRTVHRSVAVLLGTGVIYVAMYLAFGFNYLESLRAASALENPNGFMLLAAPADYLVTRLENVCEPLVYFGPFLLVLFVRGLGTMSRERPRPDLLSWTLAALATLAAMFLAGVFRTGETARACLFIAPYLMFPVAAHLDRRHRPQDEDPLRWRERKLLLCLVFGQSLVMQTFGGYLW